MPGPLAELLGVPATLRAGAGVVVELGATAQTLAVHGYRYRVARANEHLRTEAADDTVVSGQRHNGLVLQPL